MIRRLSLALALLLLSAVLEGCGAISSAAAAIPRPATLQITTTQLPVLVVGDHYAIQLQATGCNPITYSWSASNLPKGLTVNSKGLLSGAPSTEGAVSSSITVTAQGCPGQRAATAEMRMEAES